MLYQTQYKEMVSNKNNMFTLKSTFKRMTNITFEPLNESHFPLLSKWLEAPHVKAWWDRDMTYTMDLVRKQYSARISSLRTEGEAIHKNNDGWIASSSAVRNDVTQGFIMQKFILLAFISLMFVVAAKADTVLITSATGAFGEAVSFHLASEKFDLILAGRNKTKLDDLKKRILDKHNNLEVSTIVIDFSNINEIRKNIQHQQIKRLDGVILIGPRPELTRNNIPSSEEWQKALNETFVAPLEFLKQIIPNIQDNGSIVIISGNSSKDYLKAYPNTNIIRLVWTGEVKNLMHFLALRKIRVNAVSPGPILTQFHRDKIVKMALDNKITFEEQFQANAKSIPLGTYGSLDDVADLVHFLISRKSKHINGTNILLDGGESNAY